MLKFLGLVTVSVVIATVLGLAIMNYAYRMVDAAANLASDSMESN